jgi:replicative DNA helicase
MSDPTTPKRSDLLRTLPVSSEAERSLLISIIQNPMVLDDEPISPADFYLPNHRAIFIAMTDLAEKRLPIDKVHVGDCLEKRGTLEQAGSWPFLTGLFDDQVPIGLHRDYLRLLKEKKALRSIITLSGEMSEKAFNLEFGDSIDRLLDLFETRVMRLKRDKETAVRMKDGREVLQAEMDRLFEHLMNPQAPAPGILTGLVEVDNVIHGLKPGMMTILAGRPSDGKTALAMQIAMFAARSAGKRVGIFSLEMSAEALMQRAASHLSGVCWLKVESRMVTKRELEVFRACRDTLEKGMLIIDDNPRLTVDDIRSRARRMVQENGISMLVVDYLQLISFPSGGAKFATRDEKIGDVSTGLKTLLREMEIPGIILAQLNRDIDKRDNKKPKMSDLRDSGRIEQDADQIWMIHRPSGIEDPAMELYSVKGRSTGLFQPVELLIDGETQRITPVRQGQTEMDL